MSEAIKCMIVDDEPLAIELLTNHLKQIPELVLVKSTNNPIDALSTLKEGVVDLLFLDIQMPVLSGIELMKTLSNPPGVIFTTAFREYAVESYELNVIDYLVKPITFIRFIQAVNKFKESTQGRDKKASNLDSELTPNKSIFVNVNKKYVKVVFSAIRYIESVKDYIHIHTEDGNTTVTKNKLGEFEQKLPKQFLRIHRSFIINKTKVTAFTSHDIEIEAKELPIGQSYKDSVLKELK